jgi:ketosteroid isomerase-like protein
MRKANFVVLAAVVIYVLAAPHALGQGGTVEQSIKASTEQLNQAALKGDAATYDKLLADDYISINVLGGTSTKAQILENMKSGKAKFDAIEVLDSKVRVYGDAALVIGLANVKGRSGDTDISGQYRSVRVWIKQKGQWKTVSFQATRVAQ